MSQLLGDALTFLTTFSDHGFVKVRRNPNSRAECWEVTFQDPTNSNAKTYGGESLTVAMTRATQGLLGLLASRIPVTRPLVRVAEHGTVVRVAEHGAT